MPLFRKKSKTPYSAESDITASSADKIAERMVRLFTAAGLEAGMDSSRKSASRYVYVMRFDNEDAVDPADEARIRISDHYFPDKYAYEESRVDYQVFTSDMEAMAETVRAVLRRMGRPEPKELDLMLKRSRAQRGVRRKARGAGDVLADKAREFVKRLEACSRPVFRVIQYHESDISQLYCEDMGFAICWSSEEDPNRWHSVVRIRHRGKPAEARISLPRSENDSPESLLKNLVSAWKKKIEEMGG